MKALSFDYYKLLEYIKSNDIASVLYKGAEGVKKVLKVKNKPNNVRFKDNISEPIQLETDSGTITLYKASFDSLHDLYTYVKSNPRINRVVFERLHSVTNGSDFAGIPYQDAVEELTKPPREEYSEFLTLADRLDSSALDYVMEYEEVKTPGGGYIDVPSYVTGSPLCYRTSRKVAVPKFVKVNIGLSYNCSTTKQQVLNRAVIISALVSAFEKAGYIVDINTFELSKVDDEYININVNIKDSNQTFNKASLYKSLCYVEFLRRILFRVLETLDVKYRDWGRGYGTTCSESKVREVMKLGENDIYIGEPDDMNIYGNDIIHDLENCLEQLDLDDKIDIDRFKESFKEDVKRLEKSIK